MRESYKYNFCFLFIKLLEFQFFSLNIFQTLSIILKTWESRKANFSQELNESSLEFMISWNLLFVCHLGLWAVNMRDKASCDFLHVVFNNGFPAFGLRASTSGIQQRKQNC